MAARERARDSQRKSDLRQIQKALELYRQDTTPVDFTIDGFFYTNKGKCWYQGGVASSCPAGSNVYMSKIPQDPTATKDYYFDNTGSLQYVLCACLENKADPDGVSANCAAGANYTCDSGESYVVNQP